MSTPEDELAFGIESFTKALSENGAERCATCGVEKDHHSEYRLEQAERVRCGCGYAGLDHLCNKPVAPEPASLAEHFAPVVAAARKAGIGVTINDVAAPERCDPITYSARQEHDYQAGLIENHVKPAPPSAPRWQPSSFGEYLDFPLTPEADVVIVGPVDAQFEPRGIYLHHQLYRDTLARFIGRDGIGIYPAISTARTFLSPADLDRLGIKAPPSAPEGERCRDLTKDEATAYGEILDVNFVPEAAEKLAARGFKRFGDCETEIAALRARLDAAEKALERVEKVARTRDPNLSLEVDSLESCRYIADIAAAAIAEIRRKT